MSKFRYLKFFIYSTTVSPYTSMFEIEIFDKNNVNVALNKTVTASSSYRTRPSSALVDGNTTSTWWATNGSANPNGSEWAMIDLGGLYDVDRIVFHTRVESNGYSQVLTFKYSVSKDNVNWFESEMLQYAPSSLVYTEVKPISPPLNKTLILSENEYLTNVDNTWVSVSQTLPTLQQFQDSGMDDINILNREVQVANTPQMTNSGALGEGKVFKGTVDLKKYFDLRKIEVKR